MIDDSIVKSECSDILKSVIDLASVQVFGTLARYHPDTIPSPIPSQHNYKITRD
jgi:hypothetical protein